MGWVATREEDELMRGEDVATINSKLRVARKELAALQPKVEAARRASDAATPGGLNGYDSAVLSGIRRKANPKSDSRRHAAYDRESALVSYLVIAEHQVKVFERRLSDAIAERDRTRFTRDDIVGATAVRTSLYGWRLVRSVNAKTVSVDSGFSWSDRVNFGDVLQISKEEVQ